jgi:hypothetical protein
MHSSRYRNLGATAVNIGFCALEVAIGKFHHARDRNSVLAAKVGNCFCILSHSVKIDAYARKLFHNILFFQKTDSAKAKSVF